MWTWLAADLATGTIRDEIQPDQTSFRVDLNGAGGWSAQMGLSQVDAQGYNRVARTVLDPGRTIVYGLRDSVPLFAGLLWAAEANIEADALRIGGSGLWSYYQHRHIQATLTYSASTDDQFQIVSGILSHAHSLGGGNPLGLTVGWDALSGRKRDRTYWSYERKNVAAAVEELAAVDDGFDFAVLTSGSMAAGFSHELRLYYPHAGRRTSLVWEPEKNVEMLAWSLDASVMSNRHDAIGAGEGDDMLITTAADPGKLATYPLLQSVSAHKDVSVTATLVDHAAAQLGARRDGVELIRVRILGDDPDSRLGSFICGDEVTVRGSEGFVSIDSIYRVMSYEVAVDRDGDEQVTVTLATPEASGAA